MLHLYGADLIRSASGEWMIFADRTQSTSGAGYAHENRKVVSRVLPDEIREVSVRSLSPFFGAFDPSSSRWRRADGRTR